MIKAWLLTHPWPKAHFYETWRFLGEMRKRGLDAMHVNPDMCIVVGDKIFIDGQPIIPPDIVMMRHAVWNPNNLRKLGILRQYGTMFITDIEPHIDALDKVTSYQKYMKAGIPIAKTIFINAKDDNAASHISESIGWPCVIKWRFAAGSEKVFLCHDEFHLQTITGNLIKSLSSEPYARRLSSDPKNLGSEHNLTMIAQEYLDMNYMITAHAVRKRNIQATIQAMPPSYTGYKKFKANFASDEGRVQLPINHDKEISDLIENAFDVLEIEWGRVDIFHTKDGYKLCEINPSGSFPMTEVCSLKNLAGHMVDHALEKYRLARR